MKHFCNCAASTTPALAGPYDQPYSIIETDTDAVGDSTCARSS